MYASVVRVGQSYQKNGRAREGSAFSARFVSLCVCVSNKCVLPLLLGVLLTIGCDVGGDEAAADNRCAHRPPPPAIVNPFTYLCGQVAHTSANCRRFLISTSFGTAQLCEWHGRCVAGSVVDCEIPLPALPPPLGPYLCRPKRCGSCNS